MGILQPASPDELKRGTRVHVEFDGHMVGQPQHDVARVRVYVTQGRHRGRSFWTVLPVEVIAIHEPPLKER